MKYKAGLILLSGFCILLGCNSTPQQSPASKKEDKAYENSALTLQQTEEKYPVRFLTVDGKDKKNLLGQTVIRGKLSNTGKMVTYKDIEIKLRFYSKTGALLEEDVETIYETVAPGQTVKFKSKYFAAKGSDSLAIQVLGAKH